MKASKGSQFERHVCKQLSMWWSGGERDDIFWRSSQSGGRATQRAKSGKSTYGSYGDIASVDPVGEPLLKLFTIELKRGKSHGTVMELIDSPPSPVQKPFEKTLVQAFQGCVAADSHGWMLICRRDYKIPMVYADTTALRLLGDSIPFALLKAPYVKFVVRVRVSKTEQTVMRFAAIPLDMFLKRVKPEDVKRAALLRF